MPLRRSRKHIARHSRRTRRNSGRPDDARYVRETRAALDALHHASGLPEKILHLLGEALAQTNAANSYVSDATSERLARDMRSVMAVQGPRLNNLADAIEALYREAHDVHEQAVSEFGR